MVVSNMTLVKIAAIGGIATVSMGYALRLKINSNIAQSDHYKEAMKTLRSHSGAVHLLGEPIKDLLLDVSDERRNYSEELKAHYEVPIKGPKDRGVLHFWAERSTPEDKWSVSRVELALRSEPHKRLSIKTTE